MSEQIQKAIKELEQYKKFDFEIENESVDTALSALREQAARQGGCDDCSSVLKPKGYTCSRERRLISLGFNFCPMCGRKLVKE